MNRDGPGGLAAAEWVTLAVSIVIVGALVAIGIREELDRRDEEVGDIAIEFDTARTERYEGKYFVPYVIRNTGSDAIVSAELWLEVYAGRDLVETAEITVTSLPLEGTQDGVYVSAFDPDTHTMLGRLESIQFP
jgi:uncharacterized protein (TIGR02588 family)